MNIAPFHQRMRVQQTRNESSLNDSIKLCFRSALFVYKQTHNHKTLSYEKVTIFYRFPEQNERNRRENVPRPQPDPTKSFKEISPSDPFLQSPKVTCALERRLRSKTSVGSASSSAVEMQVFPRVLCFLLLFLKLSALSANDLEETRNTNSLNSLESFF